MCGIAGIFSKKDLALGKSIGRMTSRIAHRGPDDEGYAFFSTQSGKSEIRRGDKTVKELSALAHINKPVSAEFDLAFGHHRLSILDLSVRGHQPLPNADETAWLVYNGEIYNYLELRNELRALGYTFQSESDTEVILQAYRCWGEQCVQKFNGMWAFVIYDVAKNKLFMSRDRFGIKPFYYYLGEGFFVFASEPKAIVEIENIPRKVNARIVFDYLVPGFSDHDAETFFEGIYALPPAHNAVFDLTQLKLRVAPYWDLVHCSDFSSSKLKTADVVQHFRELLTDSVRLRMRSDVPVGVALSGGLDSSTVACIAADLIKEKEGAFKLQTFVSRSDNAAFDEWPYAEMVIQQVQAEPFTTIVTRDKLMEDLQRYIWIHDYPVRELGGSAHGGWDLQKLVSGMVKVCLEGHGGDELMAGYPSMFPMYLAQAFCQGAWGSFKSELGKLGAHYQIASGQALKEVVSQVGLAGAGHAGRRWLRQHSRSDAHPLFNPHFLDQFAGYFPQDLTSEERINLQKRLVRSVKEANLPAYLRQADRNSMSVSVESRLPFLDYRLVEFLFGLPANFKIRDGYTKFILREATKGILPEDIRVRTGKQGLFTPYELWIKESESLINDTLAKQDWIAQYVNVPEIKRILAMENGITKKNAQTLWRILNLALWYDMYFSGQNISCEGI